MLLIVMGCSTNQPAPQPTGDGSPPGESTQTSTDIHRGSSGATLPEYGLGYFRDMSAPELMKLWASSDPNVRNMSAFEVSRRIWNADDSVALVLRCHSEQRESLGKLTGCVDGQPSSHRGDVDSLISRRRRARQLNQHGESESAAQDIRSSHCSPLEGGCP